MKRVACLTLFLLTLFFALSGCTHIHRRRNPDAYTTFTLDRDVYARYTPVRMTFTHPFPNEVAFTRVVVTRESRAVAPHVGTNTRMTLTREGGVFIGSWCFPIHPHAGTYVARLTYRDRDAREKMRYATFTLPPIIPVTNDTPFTVMTFDPPGKMRTNGFLAPDGTHGGTSALFAMTKAVGANTFAYCAGAFPHDLARVTRENVWDEERLSHYPRFASNAKARGLRYAVWVQTFALEIAGNASQKTRERVFARAGYTPSLCYKRRKLAIDRFCALDDAKRHEDLTRLLARFENDPLVDMIGLDYVRLGVRTGVEMVDEFITTLALPVPDEYATWTKDERMTWLNTVRRNEYADEWRYFKAMKTASAVAHVLSNAGVTKPVFAFTLGWRAGFEHGQSPLMLRDAGVSYFFPMFYHARDTNIFAQVCDVWKTYATRKTLAIVPGNIIHPGSIARSRSEALPEFLRRNELLIHNVREEGVPPSGIFFYDLTRLAWAKSGTNTALDWAAATATAFHSLRKAYGQAPVTLTFEGAYEDDGTYTIRCAITNECAFPLTNAHVVCDPPNGITVVDDAKRVLDTLASYSVTNATFRFANTRDGQVHGCVLVAFRVVWGVQGDGRAHFVTVIRSTNSE